MESSKKSEALLKTPKISLKTVKNPTEKVRLFFNLYIMLIEFVKIAKQCSIGFLIMGAIGFVIKLIFLMINNILLS